MSSEATFAFLIVATIALLFVVVPLAVKIAQQHADLAAEQAEVNRLAAQDLACALEGYRLRALVDSVLACDGSDRTTHVTVEIPFDLYHALEEVRREQ